MEVPARSLGAAEPPPEGPPPSRRQRRAVHFAVGATFLLAVMLVLLLFYFTSRRDEYNAMIIVGGSEDWVGTTVRVDGPALGVNGLVGKLKRHSGASAPAMERFHVPPGVYEVNVEKGGVLLHRRQTEALTRNSIWTLKLASTRPSTRP